MAIAGHTDAPVLVRIGCRPAPRLVEIAHDLTGHCSREDSTGLSRTAPDAALLRGGQGCSGTGKKGPHGDSLPTLHHPSQRPKQGTAFKPCDPGRSASPKKSLQ